VEKEKQWQGSGLSADHPANPGANFQGDGEGFSLSSEERAGVRTVVLSNFLGAGFEDDPASVF
jgi:hypothetical protein